jgi:hypothetical protein
LRLHAAFKSSGGVPGRVQRSEAKWLTRTRFNTESFLTARKLRAHLVSIRLRLYFVAGATIAHHSGSLIMRFSDYAVWFLGTFLTLFFVTARLPQNLPEKIRAVFSLIVAVIFFFLIGVYWLATGEKFDETAYRVILCPIYTFERCITDGRERHLDAERRQAEAERQRSAAEARERETETERRRLAEAERQRLAREQEAEAERRRQAEAERLRLAAEAREREAETERRRSAEAERQRLARERELEAERRRQAEQERQRLAAEARERETEIERRRLAEAERQRQAREQEVEAERRRQAEAERQRLEGEAERQRQLELMRRHAATAVGKREATRGFYAVTFTNQPSASDAESRALSQCAQTATECKIVARFSGPGRCVFIAAGSTITREPGRTRHQTGVRSAPTEWEVLQKCRSAYETCNVFHTRCNSLS